MEIGVSFEWEVEFHYLQTVDEFDNIEDLKRLSNDHSSSSEETEKLGKNVAILLGRLVFSAKLIAVNLLWDKLIVI